MAVFAAAEFLRMGMIIELGVGFGVVDVALLIMISLEKRLFRFQQFPSLFQWKQWRRIQWWQFRRRIWWRWRKQLVMQWTM